MVKVSFPAANDNQWATWEPVIRQLLVERLVVRDRLHPRVVEWILDDIKPRILATRPPNEDFDIAIPGGDAAAVIECFNLVRAGMDQERMLWLTQLLILEVDLYLALHPPGPDGGLTVAA